MLVSVSSGSPVTSLKKLETCWAENFGVGGFGLASAGSRSARRRRSRW